MIVCMVCITTIRKTRAHVQERKKTQRNITCCLNERERGKKEKNGLQLSLKSANGWASNGNWTKINAITMQRDHEWLNRRAYIKKKTRSHSFLWSKQTFEKVTIKTGSKEKKSWVETWLDDSLARRENQTNYFRVGTSLTEEFGKQLRKIWIQMLVVGRERAPRTSFAGFATLGKRNPCCELSAGRLWRANITLWIQNPNRIFSIRLQIWRVIETRQLYSIENDILNGDLRAYPLEKCSSSVFKRIYSMPTSAPTPAHGTQPKTTWPFLDFSFLASFELLPNFNFDWHWLVAGCVGWWLASNYSNMILATQSVSVWDSECNICAWLTCKGNV